MHRHLLLGMALALVGCAADPVEDAPASSEAASTATDRSALAVYEGDWSVDDAGRSASAPARIRILVTGDAAATLKMVDAARPQLRAFDRADFVAVGGAEDCSTLPATRDDPGLEVCHQTRFEAGALVHRIRARETRWLSKWSVTTQALRLAPDGTLSYRYVIDGKTENDLHLSRPATN